MIDENIFLIGFMGSGKTSVGKHLAELLNFEFVDLDQVIERNEGKTIPQIFQEHGEEYFRNAESHCLKSLSGKLKAVIATGGGTPCFHENMTLMNSNGTTIYLKTNPEILYDRLKSESTHRPLLQGYSDDKLREFIDSQLRYRSAFYDSSKVVVETEVMNAKETAKKIIAGLK